MYRTATETVPRGSETILLVEPEPETRKLAAFMLGKQGYRILEARNATEAVRLYDEFGPAVDLLFTEARAPKVDGHELAQVFTARHPGLRVLYLSDRQERIVQRETGRNLSFMMRPFTMQILAGKVREVLDAPQARVLAAAGA
jgi:two-component system, cell cycle sensor histidine kinase and response regulator CckA